VEQWEYRVVQADPGMRVKAADDEPGEAEDAHLEDVLSALGGDGWRLVSLAGDAHGSVVAVLERRRTA
jgi:hypothetical protein